MQLLQKKLKFQFIFVATFLLGIAGFFAYFWFVAKIEKPEQIIYRVSIFKPLEFEDEPTCIIPNPLLLIVNLDENRNIKLNAKDVGNLTNTNIVQILTENFEQREKFLAYRVGTNEVEKTIIVRISPKIKYPEAIDLIEKLETSGANPIELDIDGCVYKFKDKCHW